MSVPAALSVADPPVAGGAVPGGVVPAGRRMLGLVERLRQAGMAMARGINRIARQRLEGQDLRRMAPPGFNATATNALVVQAVAWIAALRERLLALAAVRPSFVPATVVPKAERPPQGRGAAYYLPDAVPNPTEDDWHDWWDLAKPLRIGPGGVAVATQQIAGLSSQEVVAGVCDKLGRGLIQLGAEADVASITAMDAEARALLPELEAAAAAAAAPEVVEESPAVAAPDAMANEAADPGGKSKGASGVPEAGPPSDEPETEAEHEPPPKPPD